MRPKSRRPKVLVHVESQRHVGIRAPRGQSNGQRPFLHQEHPAPAGLQNGTGRAAVHQHLLLVHPAQFAERRKRGRLQRTLAPGCARNQGAHDEGGQHDGHLPDAERLAQLLQDSVSEFGTDAARYVAFDMRI